MNAREAIRRLKAFAAAKPLPNGETKRVYIVKPDDCLIVAFVRMGGESRLWGVAAGPPNTRPTIYTVPEPRNRDRVAEMCAEFAPTLLRHLQHPDFASDSPEELNDLTVARQVWLPNESHVEMLHHLAYAYAFTKYGGEQQALLNAFGRACGWLFRETQRPGQIAVMNAASVLREAYTFPTEDVRQSHLGYLMAWLEAKGGYERRLKAASIAEQVPIATTMLPELEREELSPQLEHFHKAASSGDGKTVASTSKEIHRVLADELLRRWQLVEAAIERLRQDPRRTNAGMQKLVAETLAEQWFQYNRLELKRDDETDGPAYFPAIETDRHPAAAASRYMVHQAAAEFVDSLLLHDDCELVDDLIVHGDAFRGTILSAVNEGSGRTTTPVWRVRDAASRQLRLEEGSSVTAVGMPNRSGEIRSIIEDDEGAVIEVELTSGKTGRTVGPGVHQFAPIDQKVVGLTAAFVASSANGISRMKSSRVWQQDGPGAWLTHRPTVEASGVAGDGDDVE